MTGLRVEHQCPQCGAPALLGEVDRIFTCDYCRTSSYLVPRDHFRYMLPHAAPEGTRRIYVPYWRCRGMFFSCTGEVVRQRVADHTHPAVSAIHLPETLGLRSQAMTLRPAVTHDGARFLAPSVPAAKALSDFKTRSRAALPEPPSVTALIGERLTLVYAPFYYVDDTLMDGILNQPATAEGRIKGSLDDIPAEAPDGSIRFIPTLCPNCGWDMAAEKDALFLSCPRCRSLWQAGRDGMARMSCAVLSDAGSAAQLYLPFWRITAAVSEIALASCADFARQANLPRVIPESWEKRPFHFWVPAFRLSPQAFLRTARAMTLAQPEATARHDIPVGRLCPVNLPSKAAAAAIRILLATLLRPKNQILPRLDGTTVTLTAALPVYVPFRETPHEYVHSGYPLSINRNMVRLIQRGQGIGASHFP